jgi:hypothetical protein
VISSDIATLHYAKFVIELVELYNIKAKRGKTTMRKRKVMDEPITENRRVIKIGNSFYLNLPPEFVSRNNIQPGDKVPITGNHLLKVIPNAEH